MTRQFPKWAKAPFELVIEHLRETAEYAESVAIGISSIGKVALAEALFQRLDELVNEAEPEADPEARVRLADLRNLAKKAQRQLTQGLPMLHAQLSLGVWSVLEAALEDLVVAWLCNVPGALGAGELSKVKITVVQFEEMDKESRMRFVLEEYKKNQGADLRRGIERFESLLKPLGLDGPVSESVKKDIYELSQVRNALLHNCGRMDQKLKSACPWIDTPVGEKIILSREDNDRYTRAVTNYLKSVIHRLDERVHEMASPAI